MIDLTGKSAVVTGAGRGIGAGVASTMARVGAAVAIVDVDGDAASRQASAIASAGGRAVAHAGDVLDRRFFEDVVSQPGGVDVLVNNAGIIRDNLLEKISEEDWDIVLNVNLKGAFLCSQAVVPGMKERGYGKIVNIISAGWLGNVGQSNYSASKGGLVSLTRTLALELAKFGINVNGVAPGFIDTPLTRALPDEVKERRIKIQPFRRMGTIDDVAAAVCFLASDLAGFITGQILHVDGGKSCGRLAL
jgi:3-oxoacyl-[acyl-carrier protein] reductase